MLQYNSNTSLRFSFFPFLPQTRHFCLKHAHATEAASLLGPWQHFTAHGEQGCSRASLPRASLGHRASNAVRAASQQLAQVRNHHSKRCQGCPLHRGCWCSMDTPGVWQLVINFSLCSPLKHHVPAISRASKGQHMAEHAEVTTPEIQGASYQAALCRTAWFICLLLR